MSSALVMEKIRRSLVSLVIFFAAASARAQDCPGTAEVCDGIDNDCDAMVDEAGAQPDGVDGTADPSDTSRVIGAECGSSVGACKRGRFVCANATVVCAGAVGPEAEVCDCIDNDCNGDVDDATTQALCGAGTSCVQVLADYCECAAPCAQSEPYCPAQRSCDDVPVSGTAATGSYCVSSPCGGDCSMMTVTNLGIECAPDIGGVPVCVCKLLSCHSPCFGVTCPVGEACVRTGPATGTCQAQANCYFFGCPVGLACHSGLCVDDPCDPNPCAADQACKPNVDVTGARCTASCAGVSCASGQTCVEGLCVATGCTVTCPAGEFCQAVSGGFSCGPSRCTEACSDGAYCDPALGTCTDYPCTAVHCPAGQVCADDECVANVDSGAGAGGDSNDGGTNDDASAGDAIAGSAGSPAAGGSQAAGGTLGSGGTTGIIGTSGSTGDAGPDAALGPTSAGDDGGCGCRTAGAQPARWRATVFLAFAFLMASVKRRRRARGA